MSVSTPDQLVRHDQQRHTRCFLSVSAQKRHHAPAQDLSGAAPSECQLHINCSPYASCFAHPAAGLRARLGRASRYTAKLGKGDGGLAKE